VLSNGKGPCGYENEFVRAGRHFNREDKYKANKKLKSAVFWDVMIYSLVDRYQGSARTLKMETADSSETLATLYQITRRHIPYDNNLHSNCRQNLKSHTTEVWLQILSSNQQNIHYTLRYFRISKSVQIPSVCETTPMLMFSILLLMTKCTLLP
jgi:hypothetical protein